MGNYVIAFSSADGSSEVTQAHILDDMEGVPKDNEA